MSRLCTCDPAPAEVGGATHRPGCDVDGWDVPAPEADTLRVMVTGSRDYADGQTMHRALEVVADLRDPARSLPRVLVHGTARGADTLAAQAARDLGWTVEGHPAQWSTHTDACPAWHQGLLTCKMAGHRRNDEMLDSDPHVVLGAPMHPKTLPPGTDTKNTSRGTWSTIDKAVARPLPTLIAWNGVLWSADDLSARLVRSYQAREGLIPQTLRTYPHLLLFT